MSAAERSPRLLYLHLLTLSCLAAAQPLLDLIGRNAEFLVARDSGPADVFLLLIFLILVVPLPVLALVALARRIGPRAAATAEALALAGYGAAIALPILDRLHRLPDAGVFGGAAAVGALAAWGYRRLAGLRFFLTALSPALLLVPVAFVLQRPIRTLLSEEPETPTGGGHIDSSTPVVLVIFDEISLASLLDSRGAIDERMFPSFADLARHSTWFRDTVTSADTTEAAVPAILTGLSPRPGTLPIRSDYPKTVFDLFAKDYKIYAHEPVSELAPPGVNLFSSSRVPTTQRLAGLASDLAVVYLHLLAPADLERRLPSVRRGWTGFAAEAGGPAKPGLRDSDRIFLAALAGLVRDRHEEWRRFLDSIDPDEPRALYVLHVLLPHLPWEYFPDGTVYRSPADVPGLVDEVWTDDPWLLEQAEQRYLLQLGFVDHLVGELLERLRSTGLFDRALLAVTADHGLSFAGGESRREVEKENVPEILRIPLFVKAPGQRDGRIVDHPVSSIDILPTMLDLLDLKAPWPLDGHSGFVGSPPRNEILAKARGLVAYDARTRAAGGQRPTRPTIFGTAASAQDLFRIGPAPELLGRRVAELPVRAEPGLVIRIEGEQIFSQVERQRQALPAFVTGRVERPADGPSTLELAVLINGFIRATTRTYRDPAGQVRFAALLPEAALREGSNDVGVASIERASGDLRLVVPRTSEARTGRVILEGQRWTAIMLGSERLPVVPGAVAGYLESTRRRRGMVEVNGWAADVNNGKLAREVLVFSDDRLVYSGMTTILADRVANRYGNPALRQSGFRFAIPEELVSGLEQHGLRVAAVSEGGEASELGEAHRLDKREDGTPIVAVGDGREILMSPGEVDGWVEVRRATAEGIEISGWAVDPRSPARPPEVLAFDLDRNVYWTSPRLPRPDVVAALGLPATVTPGFRFVLPSDPDRRTAPERIRIVAISSRTVACELPVRAGP